MLLNTYEPWKFAFSAENDEIIENSYGIIGVPFDSTTSYHSGSRLGPIVVREASFGFEKYNVIFNKFDCDEIKEYLENIMESVYKKNINNSSVD